MGTPHKTEPITMSAGELDDALVGLQHLSAQGDEALDCLSEMFETVSERRGPSGPRLSFWLTPRSHAALYRALLELELDRKVAASQLRQARSAAKALLAEGQLAVEAAEGKPSRWVGSLRRRTMGRLDDFNMRCDLTLERIQATKALSRALRPQCALTSELFLAAARSRRRLTLALRAVNVHTT